MTNDILGPAYALVDSGDYQKLEKFSGKLIARPSSLCLWRKSSKPDAWKSADAVYHPKKGWQFKGVPFHEWILEGRGINLKLKLQDNGQVGIFPEHAQYLTILTDFLSKRAAPEVLNLFAYSGMATSAALKAGAHVCHVDSARKALDWAKENSVLNDIPDGRLRLIADDALAFLKREARREKRYDAVICDPPSFSRLAGKKTWKLDEVIFDFVRSCLAVVKEDFLLVFSCHHHALDSRVLRNVFISEVDTKRINITTCDLAIEENSPFNRKLPAGSAAILSV